VVPNVMDINVDLPAKTVPEFIAYAKANSGKISMGSGGIGSSPHVAGELFKMMTGVQMEQHSVSPASRRRPPTSSGGRIQVLFDTLPAAIGNIRAGKIRALAVSSKKRSESLPEVPAMNEFVPGYEADSFHGISAPKGTPREIVEKLNREINAALADQKVEGAARGIGCRGVHRNAGGLRTLSRGRDRALGQGDRVFGGQGGVASKSAALSPHVSRTHCSASDSEAVQC